MNSNELVVEITGNNKYCVSDFGGKADSLNKMIRAGFPVPRAFCITVPAYNHFLSHSNINHQQDYLVVQKAIEEADVCEMLNKNIIDAYNEIGNGSSVAIRSSAIGEDSENQSFAGQYDTFLHVEGINNIVPKVKACWQSLWATRVQGYDATQVLDGEGVKNTESPAIAVIIQKMIDADCAGVLFTTNPVTHDQNTMIIEGCWGLGEGVVSGQVITDSFVVDKNTLNIVNKDINEKTYYCQKDDAGNICIIDTPEECVKQPCLNDLQIKELSEQAKKLVAYYEKDLDIEWAYKDGELWLLQARPITTHADQQDKTIYANPWDKNERHNKEALFSRMDTGEIVTGLMTPLGLSFCQFYQNNIHGPAIKTMGLLSIGHADNYMGYIQGHVYLNISGSSHMLRQCPPTRDEMKFSKRYATDEVDFTYYKNPYGEGVKGVGYLKSSLYWFNVQVKNLLSAKGTVDEMIALRQSETRRFLALDLSSMSIEDLNEELSRIDHYFKKSCAAYMPFFLQSFALYDALTEACDEHLSDEGSDLQNRIKSSMNNLRTIEVTKGIIGLVDAIKDKPALVQLFNEHTAEELLILLPRDKDGEIFWKRKLKKFLFDFGSRGRQEFELSLPRWSDDPTYLFNVIKSYLINDIDLDAVLNETAIKREVDSERLLSKLSFGARMKIKCLISLYSTMSERRESTRPTFITETWFYRCIITEVLGRLDAVDVVSENDLEYIDFIKFREFMESQCSAQEAFDPRLIERNKQQHLFNIHAEDPPMALIGGYTPEPSSVGENSDENPNQLKGLAASPGQLVGRARVITDLQAQVTELQKGEILVAKFTDASWTPLFLLASAVVTDIGSTLSHSSIVAREFGIPAVVNLKQATTIIKTGDLLVVDGSTGTVTIDMS